MSRDVWSDEDKMLNRRLYNPSLLVNVGLEEKDGVGNSGRGMKTSE